MLLPASRSRSASACDLTQPPIYSAIQCAPWYRRSPDAPPGRPFRDAQLPESWLKPKYAAFDALYGPAALAVNSSTTEDVRKTILASSASSGSASFRNLIMLKKFASNVWRHSSMDSSATGLTAPRAAALKTTPCIRPNAFSASWTVRWIVLSSVLSRPCLAFSTGHARRSRSPVALDKPEVTT